MTVCARPLTYMGLKRHCSLPAGHPGPCHTWVEDADTKALPRLWREADELGEVRWLK